MFDVKRIPTHPGEILEEEFRKPLRISQSQLAKELNTTFRTINEIINKKRSISPEMATYQGILGHQKSSGLIYKTSMIYTWLNKRNRSFCNT